MIRLGKWKTGEGRTGVITIVLAALAALFVIGAAGSAISRSFSDLNADRRRYPEGTTVNGVPIAGMTRDEARQAIDKELRSMLDSYTVTLHSEDGDIVLTASDMKLRTDADETLEEAMRGGGHRLSIIFSEQDLRRCLEKKAEAGAAEPTPGCLSFDKSPHPAGDRFTVEEGAEGLRLDVEACISAILRGETELNAPMKAVPANTSELGIPVLIAEYETSFREGALSAPNRVFNIKKAAELINGSVIAPYAVLSMNEKLGDRTAENGWLDAPGITEMGADTSDQPGGGVCQVSGTVFNAALLADMSVISRQSHSKPVAYLDMGRDATIDTDSIDLILKNRSDSDLFVFVWADEKECTVRCEIYGTPLSYDISVETELVETVEPTADEYELDSSLADWDCVEDNPAITGYLVNTYRVYRRGGSIVRRELVAESNYFMHPRRFRAGRAYYANITGTAPTPGPTARPTAAPSPAPTSAPTPEPSPAPTPEPTPGPVPTPEPPSEPGT